jgi:putative hydrolase of the HAD superfamily
MSSRPFDLVIFDLDDTLIDLDRSERLARLAADTGLAAQFLHDSIWASDFEPAAERDAQATGESYLRAFNARIGANLTRAQWIAARGAATRIRPRMLQLLSEVGARTEVALLTNNGALLREALPELVPEICALIPGRMHASCEFGARKPEPEVFRRLVARHAVRPRRALFIDDHAEYVAGAIAAGLQAIQCVDEAQLRGELTRRGVLG